MAADNRDVDSSTRAYMTRFGVDWQSEAFREDYFARRDFWSTVQGNGMLPEGVLYEMAFRNSAVGKEWFAKWAALLLAGIPSHSPPQETKKGGKAA
jgi:hypothetical protein